METYRLYSNEISSEEASLGFIRAFVNNPDAGYVGHGSIVPAVILPLGNGSRIIKITRPDSQIEYGHQVHGRYADTTTSPNWLPILRPFPTAEEAIETATSGAYQTDESAQTIHLDASGRAIPLRCPRCSHEFSVNVDHLPYGGRRTCPSCSHEDQTERFSAYNF